MEQFILGLIQDLAVERKLAVCTRGIMFVGFIRIAPLISLTARN